MSRKALAISSVIGDKHIPLIDFDREFTADELWGLSKYAKRHNLGNALIVCTKNGFHLYFLHDLVSLERYIKIMKDLKADKMFIKGTKWRGYGTLRLSGKYSNDLYVFGHTEGRRKSMPPHGFLFLNMISAFIGRGVV